MKQKYSILFRKHLIGMLLGVMSLSSCSTLQTETVVIRDSPVIEKLQGERIDIERAEYLANIVESAGNYYVFNTVKAPYYFQVYDKNFHLVDTIISKGGGPGEFSGQVMYLGQWSGIDSNPDLLAYSDAKRKLVKFSMHNPHDISTVADLSNIDNLLPKFVYLREDSIIYGTSLATNEPGGLFCYNTVTHSFKKSEPAFEFSSDLSLYYATQQTMAISDNRLCTAYINYPCVAVYDTNLDVIGRYNIGERINTATLTKGSYYPELINIRFYHGKLVVLYVPQDDKEHTLKVFGEDGQAIASYGTGDAIWYLIDEKNQRLITTNYDSNIDAIYLMQYPLPDDLK